MPTMTLRQHYYTQLDSKSWCATAQIISSPSPPSISLCLWWKLSKPAVLSSLRTHSTDIYTCDIKNINFHTLCWQIYKPSGTLSAREIAYNIRQQQRYGVRLLLQDLLNEIGVIDTLDDSQFPYRLVKSGYYVCFSHSGHKLLNKVAVVISTRYAVGIDIEVQDIAWRVVKRFYHANELAALAKLPRTEQDRVSRLLWQLKESFIKIYQYKLAQGLGIDYAALLPTLINSTAQDNGSSVIINDSKTDYQVAILPYQQTVVVF